MLDKKVVCAGTVLGTPLAFQELANKLDFEESTIIKSTTNKSSPFRYCKFADQAFMNHIIYNIGFKAKISV